MGPFRLEKFQKVDLEIMTHDQHPTPTNVIGAANVNTIDLAAIFQKPWNNRDELTLTFLTPLVRWTGQGDIKKNLTGLLCTMARNPHVCILLSFQ